jgi:hypothetical protein
VAGKERVAEGERRGEFKRRKFSGEEGLPGNYMMVWLEETPISPGR